MAQGVDQQAFREAMSRLGAAITVLTTNGLAGKHGMTASAVCAVTDTPPTLLICVNRSARSHDVIDENGVVAVNVLGGRHRHLSKAFASKMEEDRFAGGHWSVLETGAPVLDDASVTFDCRISEQSSVGSHTVFFCEVLAIRQHDRQADGLIWFGRDFHHLEPQEE